MSNALVLMTALLPTTGHRDLIEFAANIPHANVWVLINDRSIEPISGKLRLKALKKEFKSFNNIRFSLSLNDEAPQLPNEHHDFWSWWKAEVKANFPNVEKWDFVIASEAYGAMMAETINASFLPYDIDRSLNSIKGEPARLNPWDNWEALLPLMRSHYMLKAVLFGQESVGKTTIAKLVSKKLGVTFSFEYARPYLETVGEELNLEKMNQIFLGQSALQRSLYARASKPALIMDTDLYTTMGYYSIGTYPISTDLAMEAKELSGDVYYLLPDKDVLFEPDPIRYGGDKRESSREFWLQLLQQNGLNYVDVPEGALDDKVNFIAEDMVKRFNARFAEVTKFKRT